MSWCRAGKVEKENNIPGGLENSCTFVAPTFFSKSPNVVLFSYRGTGRMFLIALMTLCFLPSSGSTDFPSPTPSRPSWLPAMVK